MSLFAFSLADEPEQTQSALSPTGVGPDLRPLISRLSGDVAGHLTRALEQLSELADQVDAAELRLLQSIGQEVEGARRVGMVGQQIARLASGLVRPEVERVLACELMGAILQRRRLSDPKAASIQETLLRTPVQGDPSLMSALFHTAVDWCLEHAAGAVELQLAPIAGETAGRVAMSFQWFQSSEAAEHDALDSLHWHLLYFTAQALGIRPLRRITAQTVSLEMLLPAHDAAEAKPLATFDPAQAGCQVLVVSPERDMRNKVRLAIRGLDLMVDYVASVDAAVRYCADGTPQAVVIDATQGETGAELLRQALRGELPEPSFIEITPPQAADRVPAPGHSHVGLDSLMTELPSTLATELARQR